MFGTRINDFENKREDQVSLDAPIECFSALSVFIQTPWLCRGISNLGGADRFTSLTQHCCLLSFGGGNLKLLGGGGISPLSRLDETLVHYTPNSNSGYSYSSSDFVYTILHISDLVAPLINLILILFNFADQISDANGQVLQIHAVGPVQRSSTGRNWWPAVSDILWGCPQIWNGKYKQYCLIHSCNIDHDQYIVFVVVIINSILN